MSFILGYAIFALSVAISSVYELFWPLIKVAKAEGVHNEFTMYPMLSTFVFFLIQVIIAPVTLLLVFVPPIFTSVREGLRREIMRENPDLN